MIYIIPTKRGLGIEIWGTYDDLQNLYEIIGKFWNDEKYLNKRGFESRDKVISGLSYEIRKAKDGNRQKRDSSHFGFEKVEYLGTEISWVHILFALSALRYNMGFYETNKLDIATLLQIEFWLEKAMYSFDQTGAKNLARFIEGGLYGANEYIYQYMRSINTDYFLLNGGKTAYRKLPELLRRGVFYSAEYREYQGFLVNESKRLTCEIADLEIDDAHLDYDHLIW